MTDITLNSNETGTDESIQRWTEEATAESAAHLEALAGATANKETRKSARRALYLLSQRGILPSGEGRSLEPDRYDGERKETMRAWASAYDGAGNRLFLLVFAPTNGGSATVAQIVGNDALGILNVTLERKRLRDIFPLMERLEGNIDDGLAVAEIEPDYARQLIERFRRLNLQRCKTTPAGFLDLLPRIGTASRTLEKLPVYEHIGVANGGASDTVPSDPTDLFKLVWFDPWFFAVEDVRPWLRRWIEADSSGTVTAEKTRQDLKRAIAIEAATALITDHVRSLYITRLEESADVLRRRGRVTEARQALVHGLALKSDTPIGDIPFAEALAARTLEAAAQITQGVPSELQRKKAAPSGYPAGEPGE